MCRSGRRLRISLCSTCELQQLLSPGHGKQNTQKQTSTGYLPGWLYTAGHLRQQAIGSNVHCGQGASPLALSLPCFLPLCSWSGFSTRGHAIISAVHQTPARGCGSCVLSAAHKDPLLGEIVGREKILHTSVEETELDGWPYRNRKAITV